MPSGESYSHVYYDTNRVQHTVSSTDVDKAFVVNNDGFVGGKFTYELGQNQNIAQLKKSSDTDTDPYYGDYSDFELVITLLEDACQGLLNSLVEE